MLEFPPLSEEDCDGLLKDGEYDFFVAKAVDHVAKESGKKSIKLTLEIIDSNGISHTVVCYLSTSYMKLLKHFHDTCGIQNVYKSGKLTYDIANGQSGRCLIGRQEASGNYPAKNVVMDFISEDAKSSVKTEQKVDPTLNDDIPF